MDRGDFVGRERELRELRAGLAEALAGRGRLFLVSGEPGIGKTRLIEELAEEAGASGGVRVLWGRCWEGEGAPPFWPWVQALRSYVAECEPSALAEELGDAAESVAQLVPEIRRALPDVGPAAPTGDPDQARARLFDATVSFLRNASRRRPLLLVFDDIHWADQPSLLLVRFLARNLRDARVLVVGAYRDVELRTATGVEEMLADLSREMRHLELRGLSLGEVRQLVESAEGGGVSEAVASKLHAATDGNPLFVGEVIRSLSDEDPKEWRRLLSGRAPVPAAVRTAIRRHLTSFQPGCRQVLGVAAVIGREFDLDLLARAVGDEGAILDRLDEAIRGGMVTRVADTLDRYRFSHALVRETLYDDLGVAERPRLHRRIGQALEIRHTAAPPLADLAHHYFGASVLGETDKAIEYTERSAADAMRLLAYEEAARHLERALTLTERRGSSDERERCEILLRLGEALFGFDIARSREVFLEAATLAEKIGDGERLAVAALGVGGPNAASPTSVTFDRVQIDLLERALVALGEGETALRVTVMAQLANALFFSTSFARVHDLAEEALRIARRLNDPSTLLRVLVKTALALWRERAEMLAVAREIATLGDQCRVGPDILYAGNLVAFIAHLESGEIAETKQQAERVVEASRRGGSFVRSAVPMMSGALAALEGRFEDAERHTLELLELADETRNPLGRQVSFLQITLVRWQQGRLAEVVGGFRAAEARHPGIPASRTWLLWIDAELGNEADARALLAAMMPDGIPRLPRDLIWLQSLCLFSRAVIRLNDESRALALVELLRPYADRIAVAMVYSCFGPVALYLGGLATLLSRFDEAEDHFELALAKSARLGSPPWTAHTQHDYAKMLLRRGRAGDAAKAKDRRDESCARRAPPSHALHRHVLWLRPARSGFLGRHHLIRA